MSQLNKLYDNPRPINHRAAVIAILVFGAGAILYRHSYKTNAAVFVARLTTAQLQQLL